MVLDMVGYDIILGMDWLAAHHASVDCYKKRVCIPLEDGSLLRFCGSVGALLSPSVGRKMACCGFLSNFLGEASEVQGLGQIPVVCEFQEVSLRRVFVYLRCMRWTGASCVRDWSRYPVVPTGWHQLSRVN